MADSEIVYKKIGNRKSIGGSQSLYLGPDHLLIINGTYTETYRRLYYKDIQALVSYPTSTGKITTAILTFVTLLLAIVTLIGISNESWMIGLFFLVPAAILLILSSLQKGTCRMGIQTSVQLVSLECVSAVSKARKIEQKITEVVETNQGRLTAEALSTVTAPPLD